MENTLEKLRLHVDEDDGMGFDVEYEILPSDEKIKRNAIHTKISQEIDSIDAEMQILNDRIAELSKGIDRLTNQGDYIDYIVAVSCGVLTGILDAVFVEEFSFEKANSIGDEKAKNIVIKIAKSQGYQGDDLPGAIKYLEEKYAIAADKATNEFGGGLQHHLRDFSHHPTPVGLIFSLLTQFTHKVYGTDVSGVFKIVELKEDALTLIGKNFPEKITFGVVNWFFHMVSDMAGSSSSAAAGKAGTGLPGPIGSLLKELSALPIFRKINADGYKEFSVWVSKLFNGTLLGQRDESGKLVPIKFDLRTEIGVAEQLGKQAIPVIINECLVRGFFFIRRFFIELKTNNVSRFSELKNINWENTVPFNNRTIARMMTIATGTFTAVDIADAAIRSGGFNAACLLRVNFVGVGRFAIAVGTDIAMGAKKERLNNERLQLYMEMLHWSNAKVFYTQANMWVDAKYSQDAILAAYHSMETAYVAFSDMMKQGQRTVESVDIVGMEENNPGLGNELLEFLQQ